MAQAIYNRILVKFGGEAFSDIGGSGIDIQKTEYIADRVKEIHDLGVEISVVIGGGNLWRGETGLPYGMDRTTADHIGMIGTVMNGLALRDSMERRGLTARLQTAIQMNQIAEPYIRLRAIRHMEKGRVVIFAGGTGNPYFTTDSAAALRASEIDAEIIIKATKVDGVYSDDPHKNPDATRYDALTYNEVLMQRLRVMDMTAFTLCQENQMPIMVVNFWNEMDLLNAIKGDLSVATIIK